MVVVDDGAEISDATCVPFDRMYAVGGLEPKVDVMQTLGSMEMCPLYMEFRAILLPYAHSHIITFILSYICIYIYTSYIIYVHHMFSHIYIYIYIISQCIHTYIYI